MATKFYDPKNAPFSIHGLYLPECDNIYRRMPQKIADATNGGVAGMNCNTAGGRIRFATNSKKIVLKYSTVNPYLGEHVNRMTSNGCDIYIDKGNVHKFVGCTKCAGVNFGGEVENGFLLDGQMNEITVFLPLYGGVENFVIGLDEDAVVMQHSAYTFEKPVLYYGSSITQGACASRPGLCYQSIISRDLDCDFINLGFSGSARAELPIVEYMSELDVSVFVSDYDHNANDAEYLDATHYRMYELFRKKHPDTPYVMITKPDFRYNCKNDCDRRAIIMSSFLKAYNAGDKNVYFIDGAAFFADKLHEECLMDNVHPTDLGFERMARNIEDTLQYILYK